MISPLLLTLSLSITPTYQEEVQHFADLGDTDRTWIGEDFFANRLQDWRIRGGRLECAVGAKRNPLRAAHLLTTALSSAEGTLSASVTTGSSNGWAFPPVWATSTRRRSRNGQRRTRSVLADAIGSFLPVASAR